MPFVYNFFNSSWIIKKATHGGAFCFWLSVPRLRHRSELTERAWENAVQGLGRRELRSCKSKCYSKYDHLSRFYSRYSWKFTCDKWAAWHASYDCLIGLTLQDPPSEKKLNGDGQVMKASSFQMMELNLCRDISFFMHSRLDRLLR